MFTKRSLLRLITVLFIFVFMLAQVTPAYASGTSWKNTGSLASPRDNHTATLLPNGKVLVAGGHNNNLAVTTVELYDPTTGAWTDTLVSMNVPRYFHTATLLTSGTYAGQVLVVGGQSDSGVTDSAELYNPADDSWTPVSPMTQPRQRHTATLLPTNGKVLVVGGDNSGALASAELYDPENDTWTPATPTGGLTNARYHHTATLLANGKVLVVGGFGAGYLASAELYDPTGAGTWTSAGSLDEARFYHTATLLANGKVLVVGGDGGPALGSAELYDPTGAGTWSNTGALVQARYYHTAVLLANGKVLVIGGHVHDNPNGPSGVLASAELYDPTGGTWVNTGVLNQARRYHTATKLSNDQVLTVGGDHTSSGALSSAELYGTPVVISITRVDANPSGAGSVNFTVTFSTAMTSVDISDFTLTTTGLIGASVTDVSADSGTTRTVTVSTGTGNLGTLRLDLDDDDSIVDVNSNKLGGPGVDNGDFDVDGETYDIDRTPPTITSFMRQTPATSPTNSDTLVFRATFSEDVIGVSTADFNDSGASTATVTLVTPVSASLYDVTVSGGDLAGFNGLVGLNFNSPSIADLAGNAFVNAEPATDETYTMDNIAPDTQIDSNPASFSASTSATFTFSTADGTAAFECKLDTGSFVPCDDATAPSGTENHTGLSQGAHTFTVRAKDPAGNADATPATYTWTVDTVAPTVFYSVRVTSSPTNAASVEFSVRFFESVTGVDTTDFALATTGVTGASITGVTPVSSTTYTVTVNTGSSGNGTIHLNVLDDDSIKDAALNPLNGAYSSGETYEIDRTVTLTINSTGTQDGWILESTETSNKGNAMNTKAITFNLGDNASKKQYRSILSFSTGASIPDNAAITSVTLRIQKKSVLGGGNPVTMFKGFMVDIKLGVFGKATMEKGDFQAKASKTYGPFISAPVSNWYTINLPSATTYINKLSTGSGLTQIRLRFKSDDNNNTIANYLSVYSGNAPLASRPQLIIKYMP